MQNRCRSSGCCNHSLKTVFVGLLQNFVLHKNEPPGCVGLNLIVKGGNLPCLQLTSLYAKVVQKGSEI